MKAAVLHDFRDIRIEEINVPEISAHEVLIEVKKSGVCPSDLRRYTGVKPLYKPRFIGGHEFSGVVSEVGANVEDIQRGDRVVADWGIKCGMCYYCRIGLSNYCLNLKRLYDFNGVFAQFVKTVPSSIYHIPEGVSFEEAALTEPVACCLRAINLSNIVVGDKVLILGDGPNGLILAQLAKLGGAGKVIISGHMDERLEIGLELGADLAINSKNEDLSAKIKEITNGFGVDIAILAIGVQGAITDSYALVRKGGKIIFFAGIYSGSPQLDLNKIHSATLQLIGSVDYTQFEFMRSLDLMQGKKILLKPLITHIFPLDRISEAFEIVEKWKGLKVLIDPWQ